MSCHVISMSNVMECHGIQIQMVKCQVSSVKCQVLNVKCHVMSCHINVKCHGMSRHPNPDGLPPALILDLARICLQENSCEFLGRFFCPNSGTATGPPHACEFCDVAMAPPRWRGWASATQVGLFSGTMATSHFLEGWEIWLW